MPNSSFRAHFPVTKNWVFLDHAAVAPWSSPVQQAVNEYSQSLAEHGIASILHWWDRIQKVRELAAQLIHSPSPDHVFFVPNTTIGIGFIAEGFPWQAGDNVVLPADEYPSNQYPWLNLADRGVEVRRVPCANGVVAVDELAKAMDSRTRLLSVSAVEFSTGYRNNLADLGQLCQEKNVFFFVDAIQALGVIPLNVQQLGIHALAADGHKWMLAPEGGGFAYLHPDWLDRIHCIGVGAHSVANPFEYHEIDFRLKPTAARWEGGALNMACLIGLGASLELLLNTGIEAISEKVLELTDELCESASRHGLAVYSQRGLLQKSGIVSLTKPGQDPEELKQRCRTAGVIINNRAKRLRISPHAYNTHEEIQQLMDVLK